MTVHSYHFIISRVIQINHISFIASRWYQNTRGGKIHSRTRSFSRREGITALSGFHSTFVSAVSVLCICLFCSPFVLVFVSLLLST